MRCCSSVVERTLGKGEVESSILSSSTISFSHGNSLGSRLRGAAEAAGARSRFDCCDQGLNRADRSSQRHVPFHVMIDIAKFRIEDRQPFEIVADRVFIGHAVAAVDLN